MSTHLVARAPTGHKSSRSCLRMNVGADKTLLRNQTRAFRVSQIDLPSGGHLAEEIGKSTWAGLGGQASSRPALLLDEKTCKITITPGFKILAGGPWRLVHVIPGYSAIPGACFSAEQALDGSAQASICKANRVCPKLRPARNACQIRRLGELYPRLAARPD